ncbi:hypothetical protein ScPMuIL_014872 [Solemya velum]
MCHLVLRVATWAARLWARLWALSVVLQHTWVSMAPRQHVGAANDPLILDVFIVVVSLRKNKMPGWLSNDKSNGYDDVTCVTDGLKKLYKTKLFPLEEHYKFHDFHSPPLTDADFDAKPMILLIGQYSTGKTTFIKYLLEQEFPGIRIGPEPTTDCFITVMGGDQEGIIPGNALVVDTKKQFGPLSKFGNAFLNRFQCSVLENSVLDTLTFVDTPGILSGEKHRVDRGYDFTGVLEWFAERSDRIILLFDAHKLDISDEFRRSIEAIKNYDDKIRIILNKADMADHQQLMRVYGALMWSLGKVLNTPEVARVFIGSFWDRPLHFDMNRKLFELEEKDLFRDLRSLPRNAALRKLNDLTKRARLAKVHGYIISHLKNQMPSLLGKEAKKRELIHKLGDIYEELQREHQIAAGDFPNLQKMQEMLQHRDFSKFHPLRPKLFKTVNDMLADDVARCMRMIPLEEFYGEEKNTVQGGAFAVDSESPFVEGKFEGFDAGREERGWIVDHERDKYIDSFEKLNPINGKVSGAAAKTAMVRSKLPNSVLGRIWKLSDIDKDGLLDADEWALANYLIELKLQGHDIPSELPEHLVPLSKKSFLPPLY